MSNAYQCIICFAAEGYAQRLRVGFGTAVVRYSFVAADKRCYLFCGPADQRRILSRLPLVAAAATEQAKQDIQRSDEHVEYAGKQHQGAGDGAIGVRSIQNTAGRIDQDADAKCADCEADHDSQYADVQKSVEDHGADNGKEEDRKSTR